MFEGLQKIFSIKMIKWLKYSDDKSGWEKIIQNDKYCDFRQSYNWGQYLSDIGWEIKRYSIVEDGNVIGGIQYQLKTKWPICAVYITNIACNRVEIIKKLIEKISQDYKYHTIYFRIDTHQKKDSAMLNDFKKIGLFECKYKRRNNLHSVVDLSLSKDKILNKAKQKWRYNFRKSLKKDMILEVMDEIYTNEVYSIIKELSVLKKIRNLYNLKEIESLKKNFKDDLLIIRAKNKNNIVIGYYFCVIFNNKAYQIFNAINKEGNSLMCGYRTLIYLIDELKKRKIKKLYLGELNKNRYPGNFQFKSGFNQDVINTIGEYEYSRLGITKRIINIYLYLSSR